MRMILRNLLVEAGIAPVSIETEYCNNYASCEGHHVVTVKPEDVETAWEVAFQYAEQTHNFGSADIREVESG